MDPQVFDHGPADEPRRISIDVPAGYMVTVSLIPYTEKEGDDGEAEDDDQATGG